MKLIIAKIGGNVIDSPKDLETFLKEFYLIKESKILVHGGGKILSKMLIDLGIEPIMIEGKRVTDKKTMDLAVGVYAGMINKSIVSQLNSINSDFKNDSADVIKKMAIGLCGADFNSIVSTRRNPVPVDYGYVGDIAPESINTEVLSKLLEIGLMPVFSAITNSFKDGLLNTNADTIAQSLAVAMANKFEVSLVYFFEKEGVLLDINAPDSLVERINRDKFNSLKEQNIVSDGMIPKLTAAFTAIENGVKEVKLASSKSLTNGKIKRCTTII